MVKLYTIFDKELNQRMFYLMDNYRRVVVTSIDLDADKESASYGESVTFTAVVTDKDNNPVRGSTVSFYNINSRLGAAISNENGVANFSYVVRHDLSVNARTDDVQSNTVAVTMTEDVYDLALSCDAPIIESGGSTSVNCLLTHNGDAVSGESLNYTIKHGSTSIDSGSVTTGNDGTASISYTGTGVGDVSVEVAYGSLLQKTYELEDCWNIQLPEISIGSSQTVSSIGMDTVHNVQNEDFILIFDHKGNGNLNIGATSQYSTPSTANYRLTLGTYNNKHYLSVRTNSTDELSGSSANSSTYYTYKIEKQGTTVKFYIDDVLWQTKTVTFFSDYSAWSIYNIKWGGGTDYMRNIRLKAL